MQKHFVYRSTCFLLQALIDDKRKVRNIFYYAFSQLYIAVFYGFVCLFAKLFYIDTLHYLAYYMGVFDHFFYASPTDPFSLPLF